MEAFSPAGGLRAFLSKGRAAVSALAIGLVAIPAAVGPARAELVIDVRRGQFQPMPIAIADFSGEGDLGVRVAGIVTNNLKRSGYFAPVDKAKFPERQPAFDAAPQFEAWKAAGVQGLITGREVQRTAALGSATGNAEKLNMSQRQALMGIIEGQLRRCWEAPLAAQTAPTPPIPTVKLKLNQDGSLAAEPALVNASADTLFRATADSAMRATRRCAPLRIPAQFAPYYQDWKDLVVNFDPRET